MIHWVILSKHSKPHLDRFSRFCTNGRKVALYFTTGLHFPPQNCLFSWGIWNPI